MVALSSSHFSHNSVAVMPRPTYETWFMEGRLIPNYHYIEVKPDFSDVEERMNYYIHHPEEAEEIIRNAHAYVDQFRDEERERLISLHVLDKYFKYVKWKKEGVLLPFLQKKIVPWKNGACRKWKFKIRKLSRNEFCFKMFVFYSRFGVSDSPNQSSYISFASASISEVMLFLTAK